MRKTHTRSDRRPGWGGHREGAGRKPFGFRSRVTHATRAPLSLREVTHVTWKLRAGLPNLRRKRTLAVVQNAFERGRDRFGFRLVHFAVLSNHVHMIAEADNAASLARGLQGLAVRVAKRVNRLWRRSGTFFDDRYHNRVVRTATEVRRLLVYVLQNARRHGIDLLAVVDPFSSGPWFDGWSPEVPRVQVDRAPPVVRPRTWILAKGWKRFGCLSTQDLPAAGRHLWRPSVSPNQ